MSAFTTYMEFLNLLHSIPEEKITEWIDELTLEQLKISSGNGFTVVHELIRNGYLPLKFMTNEILRLADKDGWTVAHALARGKKLPRELMTDEILRLTDNDGETVAHKLAWGGGLPRELVTEDILKIADNKGETVAHTLGLWCCLPREFMIKKILSLRNKIQKNTVLENCIWGIRSNINGNVWVTLYPELFETGDSDGNETASVLSCISKSLIILSKEDLASALDKIPEESLMIIYVKTGVLELKKIIDKQFDISKKIAEAAILDEIFGSSESGDDSLPDFYFEKRGGR